MLLRLRGHDVLTAFGGPEALQAATNDEPELVFLDIGMPVMDGYEVARRLRTKFGPDLRSSHSPAGAPSKTGNAAATRASIIISRNQSIWRHQEEVLASFSGSTNEAAQVLEASNP